MRVIPKRFNFAPKQPLKIHTGDDGCAFIECEAVEPPSSRGKSVLVYLSPEDVTKTLLDLRRAAVKGRSTPMPQ